MIKALVDQNAEGPSVGDTNNAARDAGLGIGDAQASNPADGPSSRPTTRSTGRIMTRPLPDSNRPAIRKDLAYALLKIGENEAARDQFAEYAAG